VAPLQPLLDPAQRLRIDWRGDLMTVRQLVLDALTAVGRADAQSGQRVAVVAAFERQQCAASGVDHRRLQREVDGLGSASGAEADRQRTGASNASSRASSVHGAYE